MPALLLVLALACAVSAVPARAQEPSRQELERLAAEERQVADQLRRLEGLLRTLRERAAAEGDEVQAGLLDDAIARLEAARTEAGQDVASLLEAIASDLAGMRTGAALEAQARALALLEALLESLSRSRVRAEEQQWQTQLERRVEELRELRRRQGELRAETEALRRALEELLGEGATAADPRVRDLLERLRELQRRPAELAEEIAERGGDSPAERQAAEHARRAAEALEESAARTRDEAGAGGEEGEPRSEAGEDQGRTGEDQGRAGEERSPAEEPQAQPSPPPDETGGPEGEAGAAEASPSPPSSPSPRSDSSAGRARAGSPGEAMEEARRQQRETEEALDDALQEAERQQQELEDRRKKQELEDVRELAEGILERHRAQEEALRALHEEAGSGRLGRSQRARLRAVARAEDELAESTHALLLRIEELGASTFPFYMKSLEEDHVRLAHEIGPPRFRLGEHTLLLASELTHGWEQLVDAIRTEEERLRRRMEEQGGQQGRQEEDEERQQPLVDFAMELQLLKRMQEGLARELAWFRERAAAYAAAGLEPAPEDAITLRQLSERQLELRAQFEDMLQRLQGASDEDLTGEDA